MLYKIPSHFLFNLDIKHNHKYFDVSISIKNILNQKYHNYAVASSTTQDRYNAYPEPGREIFLSISKNF